jgi:hypothetical protein
MAKHLVDFSTAFLANHHVLLHGKQQPLLRTDELWIRTIPSYFKRNVSRKQHNVFHVVFLYALILNALILELLIRFCFIS